MATVEVFSQVTNVSYCAHSHIVMTGLLPALYGIVSHEEKEKLY